MIASGVFDNYPNIDGPTPEELKERASEGPIVVTDVRSDAIIVTSSTVKSINLPALTASEASQWIREDLTICKKLDTPVDRGMHGRVHFISKSVVGGGLLGI